MISNLATTFLHSSIPPLLLGLQHIYTNVELRNKVFEILDEKINPDADNNNGRPGMELWKILVFGVLRLNLNWDYDRLVEMTNNHKAIRKMVGHGTFTDDYQYKLQTVKDNVALLTPEILDEINIIVVEAGHKIVKKKRPKIYWEDVIPLLWRQMSTIPRTSTCFLMLCGR